MGYVPIPPAPRPTRESFHLGVARGLFFADELTLDEFEAAVHHVIVEKGTLTQSGCVPAASVFNASPFKVTR